ncbi:MAG: SHOCT domain-containing protein [Chloroflexi bacterium]|nr:SHOCT domain-containing protein [Chloroflexota bacterium]
MMGGPVGWGMMGPWMMGGSGAAGGPANVGGWTWTAAMLLGWLSMLAFWGALIVGAILLVRWFAGAAGRSGEANGAAGAAGRGGDTALEILRRRYAAGEITQDEFERMRQVLAQSTSEQTERDRTRGKEASQDQDTARAA